MTEQTEIIYTGAELFYLTKRKQEEINYKGKASLNRKLIQDKFLNKKVIAYFNENDSEVSEKGTVLKSNGDSGGYFFNSQTTFFQIPLKRVKITQNSIEGRLLVTNQLFFKQNSPKIYGKIKLNQIEN